ncbi:MAG: hydrogenase subunit MbhD domain-containing protein [Erythrobacter sp.]
MALGFDLALYGLLLLAALAAVAGADLFRAVIFFIVYGVMVAIVWARVDAVDVALAEAAIGAGLTGVLLLAAHGRLRREGLDADPGASGQILAALAGGGVALALGWAWFALPEPVMTTRASLDAALPQAGVGNPVTAVLLNFRAWDTLLESIVLLAALAGLWMLARDDGWGERLGLPQHARPGGVLASFGRALPPLGLLFGAFLVWSGADYNGGAFQGGTVLAAALLLAMMAGLYPAPRIGARVWSAALVAGPAVFIACGVAGAVLWGGFLTLPPASAKLVILVIETGLTISIAATLALLVIGPPQEAETPQAKGDAA